MTTQDILDAAERVRCACNGTPAPHRHTAPRAVFRTNSAGRRAWLNQVGKDIERVLTQHLDHEPSQR